MGRIKTIIMWVLSGFMALVALVYFPSIASIIAILFAVIAAPISPLQSFLAERGLRGAAKGIVLCAAFIGAIMATPSNEPTQGRTADMPSAQPSYHGTLPSKAPEKTSAPEPITTPEPTQEPTPSLTPQPTPTSAPAPVPTHEPTPEPTPQPTPTSAPQPIRGRSPDTIVYVSNRSNTIHSVHDCSGMTNYREMTIYTATQRGYNFCTNCW